MKCIFRCIVHFVAAVFLYSLLGLALATLMVQSKFIDKCVLIVMLLFSSLS